MTPLFKARVIGHKLLVLAILVTYRTLGGK